MGYLRVLVVFISAHVVACEIVRCPRAKNTYYLGDEVEDCFQVKGCNKRFEKTEAESCCNNYLESLNLSEECIVTSSDANLNKLWLIILTSLLGITMLAMVILAVSVRRGSSPTYGNCFNSKKVIYKKTAEASDPISLESTHQTKTVCENRRTTDMPSCSSSGASGSEQNDNYKNQKIGNSKGSLDVAPLRTDTNERHTESSTSHDTVQVDLPVDGSQMTSRIVHEVLSSVSTRE